MAVLIVAFIVLVLVAAAFALQNTAPVPLQFLSWRWSMDAGRLAVASAAFGALALGILLGGDDLRVRVALHRLQRAYRRLDARMAALDAQREGARTFEGSHGARQEAAASGHEGASAEGEGGPVTSAP